MRYDSKALTLTQWEEQREELLAQDWEYLTTQQGVVYIRKPLESKIHAFCQKAYEETGGATDELRRVYNAYINSQKQEN